MAYVPSDPSTLSTLGATALRKVIYSERVKWDSVRSSVFTAPELAAGFSLNKAGEIVIDKKGVLMRVENIGEARSGQSVRCALRTALRKRARYGPDERALGNEDEGGLLFTEFFYNEIKKATKMWMYGYNFNDTEPYDLNSGAPRLLSNFHAENDDTRFQQAIAVRYADELTYSPLSKAPQFNPNWLIPNLTYSGNPAFDTTALTVTDGSADSDLFYPDRTYGGASTFVQNIATSLLNASGTGSTPNAVINVDHASAIKTYLMNHHKVEPIMLDGQISWIWKVGPMTAGYMFNPQVSGSFGSYFKDTARYKGDVDRNLIPGEFGRLFDHYVMVLDWRTPTITVGGTDGAYTLQLGFVQPGDNDDRNNSAWANTSGATNYVFELNSILGNMAVARFIRDDMKAGLTEYTEFEQIKAASTYKGEGTQLPIYNVDSPTATSWIYRGSCITPHSVAAIDQIS